MHTYTHTHTAQHDEDIARLLQKEYDQEWDAEIARQLQEQYDDDSMAVPSGTTQHRGVQTMELPVMSTLGNQVPMNMKSTPPTVITCISDM